MMDEIRSNFDVLGAPVSLRNVCKFLLAARNFALRQDQILVGNGAAELIKA